MSFPGWETSIENVRQYSDLPPRARDYVEAIQTFLDVPGIYLFNSIKITKFPKKSYQCLFNSLQLNGSE